MLECHPEISLVEAGEGELSLDILLLTNLLFSPFS